MILSQIPFPEDGASVGVVASDSPFHQQHGCGTSDNLLDKQETQETRIRSLGPEDPLEEEMATHSSILV